MLKSVKELAKLPADSQDIYKRNVIDRYVDRPAVMEDLCLADFVALYNFRGKKDNSSEQTLDLSDEFNVMEENSSSESSRTIPISDGVLSRRRNPKILRFCRFSHAKDPFNFYRERLMLFKPWRNEALDLEKVDVEQVYLQFESLIKVNSQKYIQEDVDLDAISSEIENLRTNQDADNEREDGENNENEEVSNEAPFNNVYDYPNNTMEADVMFNIGNCDIEVPSTLGIESNKITLPELISDAEYIKLMTSLNLKQYDYVMHVLNGVKSNEFPFYDFVGGEAGVGKSKLISALYQSLIRQYRKQPGPVDSVEVMICAYTGKAAHNIGGVTAHNAFLLSIKNFLEISDYRLTPEKLNNLRVKFAKLKVIIIDEISLFGRRTFEKLNERLKEIFQTEKIFGGVSIIVLGHFGQLRPVKDDYIFACSGTGMQRLVGNCLWAPFKYFELTEIMRQKDDLKFAEALGRLSIGSMTNEDVELFNARCFSESNLPEDGKSAVRLMWRNDDVAEYNQRRLRELWNNNCLRIEYVAQDKIVGALSRQESNRIQHNLKGLSPQNTQGLASEIILQTGIRYMITANINVSDGLFNGASGILKFIQFVDGKAETLFLQFENPSIGKSARLMKENFYRANQNVSRDWTPLDRIKVSFKVSKKGNGQVRIIKT